MTFTLFEYKKGEYKQVNEKSLPTNGYTIFWYDAKMKNYLSLLEYLQKRGKSLAS